jgi:hypothetical protein
MHLLKEDAWAKYFEIEIKELRFKIISECISSEKVLQEIKSGFK